jgi:hypothetical protein
VKALQTLGLSQREACTVVRAVADHHKKNPARKRSRMRAGQLA